MQQHKRPTPLPREARFFCTSLGPEREEGIRVVVKFIKLEITLAGEYLTVLALHPQLDTTVESGCGRHDRFRNRLNQHIMRGGKGRLRIDRCRPEPTTWAEEG